MASLLVAVRHPGAAFGIGRLGSVLRWVLFLSLAGAAIALPEPPHLAIAASVVVGVALLLRWPLLGMVPLLFAVPFGSLAEVELGTFKVGPTEPLVAMCGLAWLARGVSRRRIELHGGAILGAVLAIATLALFSVTYALERGPAIKETLKWLELLLVFLLVLDQTRTSDRAVRLLLALFAAAAAEGVWGIAQYALNLGPSSFQVAGALRAYGTFEQPNPFAGYLSLTLPLALAVLAAPSIKRPIRLVALSTTVVLATAIALSQSRGAWLGLAAAFLVIALIWSRWTRRLLVPTAWLAALTLVMAFARLLPGGLVDRVSQSAEYFGIFDARGVEVTTENWAVVERMAHWQAGWYMWLDHPWLGVGAGNYAEAYADYYVGDWVEALGHAHNYYLNTLAELGVAGLGLLFLVLWLILKTIIQGLGQPPAATLAQEQGLWRALLAGVLGALVVFCIHNLFDNLFVHSVNVLLGFLIALGVLASDRVRRPNLLTTGALGSSAAN